MTRKIETNGEVKPGRIREVTDREVSSRPPEDWPGIAGRSAEDEATFTRDGQDEDEAEVTRRQRELEHALHYREPAE